MDMEKMLVLWPDVYPYPPLAVLRRAPWGPLIPQVHASNGKHIGCPNGIGRAETACQALETLCVDGIWDN